MQTVIWSIFIGVKLANGIELMVTPIEAGHFGQPTFFASYDECMAVHDSRIDDFKSFRGYQWSKCLPQMLTISVDNSPIP